MKSFLLAVAGLFLFFVVTKNCYASAEDHVDDALNVSKDWVAQIDAGRYDESYAFGCDAMRDKVPETTWEEVLKTLRSPWGAVESRRQVSHVFKPNGYEGTEGEFILITYETTFKRLDPATEVVVLKWDGGKWRGAGYNAGPKDTTNGTTTTPLPSSTETHTEQHVKPQPQ
jgi:hypothetical protein